MLHTLQYSLVCHGCSPLPFGLISVASDVFSESGDAGLPVSGAPHSFPVDVIVYFHMQPCTIRFSCQPVSRVECLLKLPSLNLVFSSKRASDDIITDGSSNIHPSDSKLLSSSIGGLSVTGVLEDFSLFVFHPYGGKMTGRRNTESERKDSLSVTVAFVKFQVSRTRKMNITVTDPSSGVGKGIYDRLGKQTPGGVSDSSRQAVIRFSTIIDIGTALFKYDMRRLAEILAFPKAWYRRTIVRRLFLGDLGLLATVNEMMDDEEDPNESTCHGAGGSSSSKESSETSRRESSNSNTFINGNSCGRAGQQQTSGLGSPQHPNGHPRSRDKLWLNLETDAVGSKKAGRGHVTDAINNKKTQGQGGGGNSDSWETLVLFAANFTKLNVHMNMGNVMGNVVWTTKGFQSNGRLSIGSSGHKDMYIGLGFGGSNLEARNGIVGGIIELSNINMYFKIKEDPGMEPSNTVGIKLFACQSRLDYMGTSVLMLRVSGCSVTLRDEWAVTSVQNTDDATRRYQNYHHHLKGFCSLLELICSEYYCMF